MARIPLADSSKLEPDIAEMVKNVEAATGDSTALRALAHNPDVLRNFVAWYWPLQTEGLLDRKLIELVRLGIAQVNQCPNCLAGRYQDSIDQGLTEPLIAKLPEAQQCDEFSDREKAAIGYGQKMATDHFAVGDEDFARLHRYFSLAETVELCVMVGQFIGMGRTFAVLDAMNTECSIEPARENAAVS